MSDAPLQIDCECHGKQVSATVCGHLVRNSGIPLGFVENSADPNDLQGWCYACEHLFLRENDKTEAFKAFNQMAVVCGACYAQIKARHAVAE